MRTALASILILASAGWLLTAMAFERPARWYKGNLHTHSLWSDGNDFPEMIVDWYRSQDYHFLALSDHNILSDHDKWVSNDLVIRRGGRTALAEYRRRFGEDWVLTREEAGKLQVRLRGLAEFRDKFEAAEEFLLVPAEEITDSFENIPIHINASNLAELIEPQGGASVRDVIANNLDKVQEQSDRLGRPILVHLNHPNYGFAVTAEDLAAVAQERFFEVYNGHPSVYNQGDEQHAGTERVWDIVNALRLSAGSAAPLFGMATDDSHNYHNASASTPGRGWVMVRASELSANALISAMERGEFYASTGVELEELNFVDGQLSLKIRGEEGASYLTRFIATAKDANLESRPMLDAEGKELRATRIYSEDIGREVGRAEGLSPSYRLTGDEMYVRAVVSSSQAMDNPVQAGDRKMAWTQPMGWSR